MWGQVLNFAVENQEWVIPLVVLLVGEVVTLWMPTKDPAGLSERIGRIIRIILESKVQNRRINFQNKVVKNHNKEKLK